MTPQEYTFLVGEVHRFRPPVTVGLAVLVVLPSLWELVNGNLSAVDLLARLALAIVVSGLMVWLVSGVVLHYARVQVRSRIESDRQSEFDR